MTTIESSTLQCPKNATHCIYPASPSPSFHSYVPSLSKKAYSTHESGSSKTYYGTMQNAFSDTNEYGPEDSTPPTPNYTTVSPNDEDEGLYLLWTHQLLRERGFRPTSCRNSTLHEDDDLESDDSSLTNRSIEIKTTHSHRASTPHLVVEEPPQRSTLYTFFSTVFPCL